MTRMEIKRPGIPDNQKRFDQVPPERREQILFSLEFYAHILEKKPYQCEALSRSAEYLTELGYYEKSLLLDLRLSECWPDDQNVQYNLACSFALLGKIDQAMAALEKAMAAGYLDYRHARRDQDLVLLHGNPGFIALLSAMRAQSDCAHSGKEYAE